MPFVSDPLKIVEGIHRYAIGRGSVFHRQEGPNVELSSESVIVETTDGMRDIFDGLVIAAGAWSRQLINQMGDKVVCRLSKHHQFNKSKASPQVSDNK